MTEQTGVARQMWDAVYTGTAIIVRPDGVRVRVKADLRSVTTGTYDDWMGWVKQTSGHKWAAIDPDAKYFLEFEGRRDSISFVGEGRPGRGKRFYLVGLGPRLPGPDAERPESASSGDLVGVRFWPSIPRQAPERRDPPAR